ncbi:von Willebrand factor A domain-containing protein 5B1 [Alosa sapidissima]|uniref:von Willebrand factor A domain-containing protein 5B1 n=1 Tax=Alosa sapidissima TaxID=34773 RepID=UPI001C0838FE|nr:von Willebrand factor A domain-containing protein 5B1 [Alosa sapidissima]
MPGLINKEKWKALPLSVSDVSSCIRGYTLAMTASLTYDNMDDHPIEGIFIYPLEECSTVVGFEAMISSQIITVQIKDKTKIDDCYFDCCSSANGALPSGSGHVVMEEDLERTVLVVNLGVIPPLETVSVLVSTSSELSTLPGGGIRVTSPPVCTPRVERSVKEEQAFSPGTSRRRERHHCALGPHDQVPGSGQLCLAWLLEDESINSIDYDFNFQLEIRSPYLLAGVESPSHAIRADADPCARSATNIVVTLADKYTYDWPVEILIYPSEPHVPHVLVESGDMMLEEYDEYLRSRSDFIKGTKKDASDEKKVEILRKRLHKDILHNPVVMLNLCPDLKAMTSEHMSPQGEFIFLIDRSGSMSGMNISCVKDVMVVILKSLFPACLFNIVGFGSSFKTLFTTSQPYDEDNLAMACEYISKIRADMGGTNLLAPLSWILRQPMHRGHPRLIFLLTDGAVSNTGRVIDLVRRHARFTRCYTFGIGQSACRRLAQGLATVSKGIAEFFAEGERLQPKMIKILKKSMTPVLSDISIEWLFPETKEVLLSPVGNTYLFPGDRLIGYCAVCDTTRYHPNPKSDKRRRYSMMRSNESASSVFYHSQEEDPARSASECPAAQRDMHTGVLFDGYQDTMSESSALATEHDSMGMDPQTSPRRRAYSTNQITNYNPAKRVYTPSDPSSVVGKNPLRRAKIQELIHPTNPDHGAQWKLDYQPQLASLCAAASRGHTAGDDRSSLLQQQQQQQQQEEEELAEQDLAQPCGGPQPVGRSPAPASAQVSALENGSRSSSESPSVGSTGEGDGYAHQLCEAETPQDPHVPAVSTASCGQGDCKAVVSGLLCGKEVKWEVTFDIEQYLQGREREEKVHEELWNETFHHLAAHSIIQDFEQMAERECEIEHGSGRRYQLYAIHTSKACNILSKFTAFVPIDLDTNEYLPTSIEYLNVGEDSKKGSQSSSRSGSRKKRAYSIGLGRSQSGCMSEAEDGLQATIPDDGPSPCGTPSSTSGWETYRFTDASQRSPSVTSEHSQRSVESLFSARLSLTRTRLLTKAARGFMSRSQSKTSESAGDSDNDSKDYIPLVSLQLACGAFALDSALCEAIGVPMNKLKWTSPFSSHRHSLPHLSHSSSRRDDAGSSSSGVQPSPDPETKPDAELSISSHSPSARSPRSPRSPHSPRVDAGSPFLARPSTSSTSSSSSSSSKEPPHSPGPSLMDSGHGSEAERAGTPEARGLSLESMVWATAVALAWLEHSSASYFIEWELVAAKASMWLGGQSVPEGRDLASVKAAANQLFIILRHWDENLQLNMLCYNPKSV